MKTGWIFVGLGVVVGVALLIPWLRRRRALAALEGRESLGDDALYARYYAESNLPKALVLQLWHEIADTLKVPAAKLRPDDSFGKDVGTYWITSDDLDVLAEKGRARAKALGVTVDLQKLGTVDDYVRSFTKPV